MKNLLIIIIITLYANAKPTTPKLPNSKYHVHDSNRPFPEQVKFKDNNIPSDAIVLFDGKSLDEFTNKTWKISNNEMIVGKGNQTTKRKFGDIQLHIEWCIDPNDKKYKKSKGQNLGNSGIFFMDRYEIQILDCYDNKTYADGATGAIYGQYPPLVNACKKAGQWNTYNITFIAPKFDKDGKLISPAYVTVLLNGVLLHNKQEIIGPTKNKKSLPYIAHENDILRIQDHKSKVHFRNIWLRKLK